MHIGLSSTMVCMCVAEHKTVGVQQCNDAFATCRSLATAHFVYRQAE